MIALNKCAEHRKEALKLLRITDRTLYRYLKKYPIVRIKGKYRRNDKNTKNKNPSNKTKQ